MGTLSKLNYPKDHPKAGQQRNKKGLLGWQLRWQDPTVFHKRSSTTFYGSEGSAREYLGSLEESPLANLAASKVNRNLTVGELRLRALTVRQWAEEPLDGNAGVLRRASTYAKFRSMMKMLEGTELDGKLARTVTANQLTQFVNQIKLKNGSAPAEGTLATLDSQLGILFAYAVAWGVIRDGDNPAKKNVTSRRSPKPKPVTWAPSLGDVTIVAEILGKQNDWLPAMLWVFYWTGMRCEETMGLKITDIDFTKSSINVIEAVTVSGGQRQEGPLKSEASKRSINIVTQCRPHLEFLCDRAKLMKSEYVFTGEGRPSRLASEMQKKVGKRAIHAISYSTWRRTLSKAVREAEPQGVRYFTSHILRHAALMQLLRAGYSPLEVGLFAGHRDDKIVMTKYAALVPNDLTAQAMEMSERLAKLT
jgi:integrase